MPSRESSREVEQRRERRLRQVNVYLPLDLARRLHAVRDRINVSSICQDAIEAAVQDQERVGSDERRARVVHRLLEAEAVRERAFRQGVVEGQRWAEEAGSWPDIQEVAKWPRLNEIEQLTTSRPRPSGWSVFTAIPTLTSSAPRPAAYIPPSILDFVTLPDGDDMRLLFWRGFREGVGGVFNLVRDAMLPEPPAATDSDQPSDDPKEPPMP